MTLNRSRYRLQDFLIEYLEYEERYNVGLKIGQISEIINRLSIGHLLWSWITMNWPTSSSSKLHVKYCENGDRYNNCVNESRTGPPVRYWLAPWTLTLDDLKPSLIWVRDYRSIYLEYGDRENLQDFLQLYKFTALYYICIYSRITPYMANSCLDNGVGNSMHWAGSTERISCFTSEVQHAEKSGLWSWDRSELVFGEEWPM